MRHRNRLLCLVILDVCLSGAFAFGQSVPDPWLILASGQGGSITAHTTREELVRAYGASNVTEQDAQDEDGEIEQETILFANDPECRIDIMWKDPDKKTEPASLGIGGQKSRWHGVYGITLGTTF